MRVLVVDRKALLRDSLAALVRAHIAGLEILTQATVADAAPLMGQVPLGLLILEAEQAAGDQLLAAVRLVHPGWRVVLLGGTAPRSRTSGVEAHLGTDADSAMVIAEIRRLVGAWSAQPVRPAADSEPAVRPERPEPPAPWAEIPRPADRALPTRPLTRRQQDVLNLLAQGRSTKDIARTLDLGIGTIKAHLDGLYRTLGVHNRVAAVARVQQFVQIVNGALAPEPRARVAEAAAVAVDNVIRLDKRAGHRPVPSSDEAAAARSSTAAG
jgi:DNA-binding NarL/FixJ family response regulator